LEDALVYEAPNCCTNNFSQAVRILDLELLLQNVVAQLVPTVFNSAKKRSSVPLFKPQETSDGRSQPLNPTTDIQYQYVVQDFPFQHDQDARLPALSTPNEFNPSFAQTSTASTNDQSRRKGS